MAALEEVAIWLSVSAVVISFVFSLIGSILTWKTYSSSFKPILDLNLIPDTDNKIILPVIKLRNIGNGPALNIEVKITQLDKKYDFPIPNLQKDDDVILDLKNDIGKALSFSELLIIYYNIAGKKFTKKYTDKDLIQYPSIVFEN